MIVEFTMEKSYLEFLLNDYFGSSERTIEVCAQKAYKDLQRRLIGIGKVKSDLKQKFKNDIGRVIYNQINKLTTVSNQLEFDTWHMITCEEMIKHAQSYNLSPMRKDVFRYGIAQKWLNMTLKYMLVMGKWDSLLNPVKEFLHAPVDDTIIRMASDLGVITPSMNGWSHWEQSDYTSFQKELRQKIPDGMSPIDWEFKVWEPQTKS